MNNFDRPVSFDCLYSQAYYNDYFKDICKIRNTLSTYYFEMDKIKFNDKLMNKVYGSISFRTMNVKRFKEEIILFGELCKKCLKGTYLYFERQSEAMFELINEMRFFLKPENLIFALKDGREIGYLFWHPDYNEIFPGGRKNSILKLAFKYLTERNKIRGLKLNVIGILPEYQNTGVLIGLVHQTHLRARKQFVFGETNFVWDNNRASSLINSAMTEKRLRQFGCAYNCSFCFCVEIARHSYYERELEDVIKEIKTIREKNIFIVDDNFLFNEKRVNRFCDLFENNVSVKTLFCLDAQTLL